MTPLSFELPAEVAEAIAQRAAEIVLAELRSDRTHGRWLTGAQAAADYLGCSRRRIYNLREIPRGKHEGRLVFHTADLDAWLRGL